MAKSKPLDTRLTDYIARREAALEQLRREGKFKGLSYADLQKQLKHGK